MCKSKISMFLIGIADMFHISNVKKRNTCNICWKIKEWKRIWCQTNIKRIILFK